MKKLCKVLGLLSFVSIFPAQAVVVVAPHVTVVPHVAVVPHVSVVEPVVVPHIAEPAPHISVPVESHSVVSEPVAHETTQVENTTPVANHAPVIMPHVVPVEGQDQSQDSSDHNGISIACIVGAMVMVCCILALFIL